MNKTTKIIISLIALIVLLIFSIYFLQKNILSKYNKKTNAKTTTEPTIIEEQDEGQVTTEKPETKLKLTKYYLVENTWGPEDAYGMQIKFNADGTFTEQYAGETGDLPVSGSFEIIDDAVILTIEKYGDLSLEEAQNKYHINPQNFPNERLTLERSNSSFLYNDYLADDLSIAFWNRSSKAPAGEERQYGEYTVITTQKNLVPQANAILRENPTEKSGSYLFYNFDDEQNTLEEVFGRVLARTQFTEKINGVEDYWYLVKVITPWYSRVELNGVKTNKPITTAWIHGSQMK